MGAGRRRCGAKVALIERHRLGGKSLSDASVPTKALLRTSRLDADMRNAKLFGARPQTVEPPDLGLILGRARRIRNRIGQTVTAAKLKAVGVDLYFGTARSTGSDSVDVDGLELRFTTMRADARAMLVNRGSRQTSPAAYTRRLEIHIRDGSDKILGATIVARHASEMINEISLAIGAGVGLKTLAKVLRAYPTQAEAIRLGAERYRASP